MITVRPRMISQPRMRIEPIVSYFLQHLFDYRGSALTAKDIYSSDVSDVRKLTLICEASFLVETFFQIVVFESKPSGCTPGILFLEINCSASATEDEIKFAGVILV